MALLRPVNDSGDQMEPALGKLGRLDPELEELLGPQHDFQLGLAPGLVHVRLQGSKPYSDILPEESCVRRSSGMVACPHLRQIGYEKIVALSILDDDTGAQIGQRRHEELSQLVITLTRLLPCQRRRQSFHSVSLLEKNRNIIVPFLRLVSVPCSERWLKQQPGTPPSVKRKRSTEPAT